MKPIPEELYVPGDGDLNANLMVIGEAPGASEHEQKKPFVGPSGELVNEMLANAGIDRNDCYVTNVVKVRPPDNKIKRLPELGFGVEDFLPQLKEEIDAVRPNCILALGNTALKFTTGLSGITVYRGSILPFQESVYPKVVPSIHPANIISPRGGEVIGAHKARAYVQLDFNRAVEESRTKELHLPDTQLQIARSYLDVFRFFKGRDSKQVPACDIEVHRSIPFCVSFAFTKHHAISVPLIPIYGMEKWISEMELARIWQFLYDEVFPKYRMCGQNFKFDHNQLELFGFRLLPPAFDTMFAAHTLYPEFPQSLQFLTSIYTRHPYYKDELKEFDPRKQSVEVVLKYNARDSIVTKEVQECQFLELNEVGLHDFFIDFVMPLHELYRHIELTGFYYDPDVASRLISKYLAKEGAVQKELNEIAGSIVNYNSPIQVARLLYETFRLPLRKGTGNDVLTALLANVVQNPKHIKAINLVLDGRRISKTLSTYLLASPDPSDARMRTSYRVTGTESGRTSTSRLGPPQRPFDAGLAFQTITKHGDIGQDIGEMLRADPGHVILQADQAQAESRAVALLARDNNLLRMINDPAMDVHKYNASNCLGLKYEAVTKDARFIGKVAGHAYNYDIGKRTMMLSINTDAKRYHIPVKVSEWKAGKIIEKLDELYPGVRQVFQADVRACIETDRTLITPWGRKRQFFGEEITPDMLRKAYSYIPQSTIGDLTKKMMLKFREKCPAIRIVIESHDGFAVLCPKQYVREVGEIILEIGRSLVMDFSTCSLPRGELLIPWELEIGDDYAHLETFEV